MTIFYIKMKIRAGGGTLGQQGAPPCYSSLWETLVTHLKMTVYKGIGKHSFSQSPAMKFDRSAVSLRLNMGYVDCNRM